MLTLAVYARYARKPSIVCYLLVAGLFALGLMAKAMLATVPLVLLLLDYWPLNRNQKSEVGSQKSETQRPRCETKDLLELVVEKLPLLALSAASCVVTVLAQKNALYTSEHLPMAWRAENALSVTPFTYGR